MNFQTLKAIAAHVAREWGPYIIIGGMVGWAGTSHLDLSTVEKLMAIVAIGGTQYAAAVALYATVATTRLRLNKDFAAVFASSVPEARAKLIMRRSN